MAKMHSSSHHEPITAALAGRTAIVTGSSSGIGRAIALELASAGADVLIHARSNRRQAEATAKQIEQMGRRSCVALADLASSDGPETFFAAACQWQQPIHIWVNNAGADVLTGEAADWSFEQKLETLWKTDVLASIRLSRLIGQHMQQQATPAAAILNMGWDQAATGMAGNSGEMFAAVKGAVMAFTKSLAKSLAPQVRVNCLAPGWIKTAWGEQASDSWQQRAKQECLLARWGTPEDVAQVARFLVSQDAGFITGQVVPINGGLGQTP